MKKRVLYGLAIVLLVVSVLLVVWQGSFRLGKFSPEGAQQALIYWATLVLIFILMVVLAFNLAREFLKLYVARQANEEGSRIRTKLVAGALTLSIVPVFFLVFFSYEVFSFNVNKWFTEPVEGQKELFIGLAKALKKEIQDKTDTHAALLALQTETRRLIEDGERTPGFLERFAREQHLDSAAIYPPSGGAALDSWQVPGAGQPRDAVESKASVPGASGVIGVVVVRASMPLDTAAGVAQIDEQTAHWNKLSAQGKDIRKQVVLLMALITLFVIFVATWTALFLAKQISVPITALLEAAREVRKGNLTHRVQVQAADELGLLVRGFNQMTLEMEANQRELDRRRRFTEAILESIPTGVISISSDGRIQRVNRPLLKIFPAGLVERASRLEDLFSRDDTAEIKYLMKRARRTGVATRQLELRTEDRVRQVAATVSALDDKLTSGFVIVLEDTSELLHAQKAAAWHEVARRVAHEIKNPLTPIGLSAERIARQVDRLGWPPAQAAILRECSDTISKSVESVKTLVDEFSQFARFPSAHPVRADLNQVVEEALLVFQGRLEGISLRTSFAPNLPPVNLDPEQFQRVVINLVDNAAEAMQDALVKELYIATQAGAAETVELVVADSGCGVSPDDKEKLFLPYFSTKNRGTGLGLAIVSHIVAEHNGQIRVEDNRPVGARFTVEIPVPMEADSDAAPRPVGAKI
ncbi:MAG TPA: ATP-binding protein [Bryobacteraceae bacterium]|nr:ATP-binding protein [Bryobacteraceae bacterium]